MLPHADENWLVRSCPKLTIETLQLLLQDAFMIHELVELITSKLIYINQGNLSSTFYLTYRSSWQLV